MANWLKTWLFLLLLSAQFALAGSVRVVITTDSALQPAVAEAVKRELAAQLTPAGIALDWVVLGEGDIYPHLGRTVQVVLKGRCVLPPNPGPRSFAPGPFAETPVVDGEILSFSTIDCDRVSQAVRQSLWGGQAAKGGELLGIAVGRVLAHEMYHILGQAHRHGREGVGKESLTGAELIAKDFSLAAEELAIIHQSSRR